MKNSEIITAILIGMIVFFLMAGPFEINKNKPIIQQLDTLTIGSVITLNCTDYKQFISTLKNKKDGEQMIIEDKSFEISIEKNYWYLYGTMYDLEIPFESPVDQIIIKKTVIDQSIEKEN